MAAPSVGFDGMDINDGTIYSILPDIDLGGVAPTFDEYRSYAGTVTQANVSTANLVQMVIPMKIQGTSVANLGANLEALNAKIRGATAAAPHALVFDGVTYSIVTSPEINPPLAQSYQNKYIAMVDMVLNRLPTVSGIPGGGGGGGWTPVPGMGSAGYVNVVDYGAVGNGVADDTTAIQAAIDAVAATSRGGTVYFPGGDYKTTASLVPKDRVALVGCGAASITETGTIAGSRIVGNGGFAIIDAGNAAVISFSVERMGLIGSQSSSGSRGIASGTGLAYSWILRDLYFDSFADQAVYLKTGISGHFSNLFIQNACMKRADHSTYLGAFQLGDSTHTFSDAYLEYVQATCSFPDTAGGYLSGYHCGLYLGTSVAYVNSCMGHMSETGYYFPATYSMANVVQGCRADLNQGHGFIVEGGAAGTFTNCLSYRNSRSVDATYSGFRITNGGNNFVGCRIDGIFGEARQMLYGFDDGNVSGIANNYTGNTTVAEVGLLSGGLYHPAGTLQTTGYVLPVLAGNLVTCTDSETNYWGYSTHAPQTSQGDTFVIIPRSGTIRRADINWYCDGATSTENVSLYVRRNASTDTLIQTIGDANSRKYFGNSSLNIPVAAGDGIEIKNVFPSWGTNPANLYLSGVLYIETP